MEIDSNTQMQVSSGGITASGLMKAANPNAPENTANVLFQPVAQAQDI